MLRKFISDRLKERTSLDGVILVTAGVCFLVFKPIASIVAYGAIVWGVYTLLKGD